MKSPTERRARILRIRTIQRRHAEIKLAAVDSEVRQVSELAHRIDNLRVNTGAAAGGCCGADLQAVGQMVARLDEAKRSIAAPLHSATEQKRRLQDALIIAKQRETHIEKLLLSAAKEECRRADQRTDASTIFRKPAAESELLP